MRRPASGRSFVDAYVRAPLLALRRERGKSALDPEDAGWLKRSSGLNVVPLELREANDLVARLHRHHEPVQGHRFSIGVEDAQGVLRGCAIVGRPVSRHTPAKEVLEITRCATDGTSNAASALYGAVVRIGREMGYRKVQTFVLDSEDGASLRAAGFEHSHDTPGGSWSSEARPREDKAPTGPKSCWAKELR
jgi:hypothetical protein